MQQVTDEMVSRFLTWELPRDFAPDCGIAFENRIKTAVGEHDRAAMGPGWWPTGTNLLNALQARKMLEHVLGTPKEMSAEYIKAESQKPCYWIVDAGDKFFDVVSFVRAMRSQP